MIKSLQFTCTIMATRTVCLFIRCYVICCILGRLLHVYECVFDLFEAPQRVHIHAARPAEGPFVVVWVQSPIEIVLFCLFFSISPLAFYILNAYFVLCEFRIIIYICYKQHPCGRSCSLWWSKTQKLFELFIQIRTWTIPLILGKM